MRKIYILMLGLNVGRVQAVGVGDGLEACCWGLSGHWGLWLGGGGGCQLATFLDKLHEEGEGLRVEPRL